MAKTWNVVVKVETKDPNKPYWHTIGRAWESEHNPGSFKLQLNSLPLTRDVYLFLDRGDRGERPKQETTHSVARDLDV